MEGWGGLPSGGMLPKNILNFEARKCHFLRYPQDIIINTKEKNKWLEYILPISNAVVKVQCLRKKRKTVT